MTNHVETVTAEELSSPRSPSAHQQRIAPAILLIATVFTLWASISIGFGTVTRPGPGFWPGVVSVIAIVLAAVVLVMPNQAIDAVTRRGLVRVVAVVTSLYIVVALKPLIGFFVPFAIATAFILIYIARVKVWLAVTIGVGTSVGAYLIFAVLLGVSLRPFS